MKKDVTLTEGRRGYLGLTLFLPNFNAISGLSKDEERVYEAHIVIQLGSGRAFYCQRLKRLYFFDAADKEIGAIIKAVLNGLGRKSDIESVRLDQHRCMAVGKKIQLEDSLLKPVFTALALSGVTVEGVTRNLDAMSS